MKLVSALVGLAALGAVALSSSAASAMPVAIPGYAPQSSNVQQAAYCNDWVRCWDRPSYGDGHWHPHYFGGLGWHHGWGYGWLRWHPGWGYWHR
jgi:hypothetical protein